MAETRTTRARAAQAAAVETPPPKPNPLKRKKKGMDVAPTVSTPVDGPEPAQESLPIRLVDGQPLPTLRHPQPTDLPLEEYQSIIQSGVLNASLKRSREVWLSGCHFKKYYTKPTVIKKMKERTQEDKDAIARDKVLLKAMIKIGDANFTVDPHIFTVSIYTIKDAFPPPTQRYAPQYGTTFAYQSPHTPMTPQYKPPVSQPPRPAPVPPKQQPTNPSTPNTAIGAQTPAGAAAVQAAPDPVIHMLAQRAGTDPELKSVMKIVAAGQATPQQLEFFQGHINELTKILEAQKAAQAAKAAAAPPAPPPAPPAPAPQATPARPIPATPAAPRPPPPVPSAYSPLTPYNAYGAPQPHHHNSPYGPPSQPQKPLLRPIVFEFHENNADKLYFPEHSILEFLPGGRQLRASFLVTKTQEQLDAAKKGSATPIATPAPAKATPKSNIAVASSVNSPAPDASASKEQDKKEEPKVVLYQPVTALVAANDPRVIEWFARAVHPPDIVEKYMNEVFDTAKPAEETYLALRLPRDEDVGVERTREASPRTPAVEAPPERKKMAVGRPRKESKAA